MNDMMVIVAAVFSTNDGPTSYLDTLICRTERGRTLLPLVESHRAPLPLPHELVLATEGMNTTNPDMQCLQ